MDCECQVYQGAREIVIRRLEQEKRLDGGRR